MGDGCPNLWQARLAGAEREAQSAREDSEAAAAGLAERDAFWKAELQAESAAHAVSRSEANQLRVRISNFVPIIKSLLLFINQWFDHI